MTWRRVRRVAGLVTGGALIVFLLSPTGCYLSRAGWEEAKILKGRKPIARLVTDSSIDVPTREKLRLVRAVRSFAVDSVRLNAKESFTTYSRLERDTLVLVVSGAYRDRLKMHTWWFPIVGRVPYKGFFDFKKAQAQAKALEKKGLDANVRPASAFSTLGWFNDPVLSTTLRGDSLGLAETVVHELTHNTFYAPGQAVFNESFANFVGHRGAAWFYRTLGDTTAARRLDDRWFDEIVFGGFWTSIYHSLDSAFTAHPGDSARLTRIAARDTVFARARRSLEDNVRPALRTVKLSSPVRVKLDNSIVMSRRIYLTDLPLFDAVYDREGRDLRAAIRRIIALAKSEPKDPYGAIRSWLSSDRQ
jgi:predicted aminopeptidase